MSTRKDVVQKYIEGFRRTDHAPVAIGSGSAAKKGGERFAFVFCDVFTFRGDLTSRLETYLVGLT